MAIRHPSQREEGRLDPALGEQVEHFAGIVVDAAFQAVPVGLADHALERADLEPFLDVDR
jgi:hypothetical protein